LQAITYKTTKVLLKRGLLASLLIEMRCMKLCYINLCWHWHCWQKAFPRLDWTVQCFTSPPTQYRLYGRLFLQFSKTMSTRSSPTV